MGRESPGLSEVALEKRSSGSTIMPLKTAAQIIGLGMICVTLLPTPDLLAQSRMGVGQKRNNVGEINHLERIAPGN